MNNRLQFRHHSNVFETREDAIGYIKSQIRFADSGLSVNDRTLGYSLFSEPTVLRYKNEEDETNPHIILAIGSVTNEGTQYSENRFCIIDIDKTEEEIADLQEELEKALKSLTIVPLDSETLNLYANKTDDGTYVSGDVKVADSYIFNDVRYKDNLMVTPDGIFMYVNLDYDKENEEFTFTVSNSDGTLSATTVDISDDHLISGRYSVQDESLHFNMKKGDEIVVDCKYLIAEWDVIGDAAKSPVILTKEEVKYGTEEYSRLEPWQDVLKANVRIKDEEFDEQGKPLPLDKEKSTNILQRTSDGRYLYVDGKASNIVYYRNGELSNVKDTLDDLVNIKLSSDSDNIITEKTDGFFASSKLEYVSKDNKLVFKTSGQNGEKKTEILLNSVELFEHIYYDPTKEALIVTYKDNKGVTQFVEIPIGDMIRDWEWEVQNEGHNIKLIKVRKVSGNDKVSADAKIFNDPDNILVDKNHELFVKGTSDNIRHGEDSNVKKEIDTLHEIDYALDNKINLEIARAENAEETLNNKIDSETARATREEGRIDTTIGNGFSTDAHETVTYKFEQLQNQVNSEADKLQGEIDRSEAKDTEHDGRLDAIDTEIGDGFGARNTVRDEVDAVKDSAHKSIKDVINTDNSIDVSTTGSSDEDNITKVVKVNLSAIEPNNTLRLEHDGLYNFIDLNYNPDTNKLTLTKSDNASTENVSKEIQLNSVSIIDGMEYDPTTETLIIKYHSGSEQKELRIPLGEIFQEWEVYNDPNSAIKLNRQRVIDGKDKLSGEVVITTAHDDNILKNEHGALYVSGQQIEDNKSAIAQLRSDLTSEINRAESEENTLNSKIDTEVTRAISAETALQTSINNLSHLIDDETSRAENAEEILDTKIDSEEARARETEQRLDTRLEAEISRAQTKEGELNAAIVTETLRAQNADNELYQKIADETSDRTVADADLSSRINQEVSRAQVAENTISEALETEKNNRENADTNLSNALTAETQARQAKDAELEQMIIDATLTFDDTTSIDFNIPSEENNVVKANVKIQGGDNLIKLGQGLYATAHLSYDTGTNKIKLTTTAGEEEYQLAGATVIDSLVYDSTNKALVITYHDGNGGVHTVSFPVAELFNEWDTYNASENSAVELTKTPSVEPGGQDKLSGRILLTNLPDNAVQIVNNGLYVSSSAMSEAEETAECTKNELKVLENVVLGHQIGQECGEGYRYEPNPQGKYTNSATSFSNADFILDQNLARVESKIDESSDDVECIDKKANKIYEMLYGEGSMLPECGEGARYQPYVGACIISAATSFNEADQMLNDQICELLTMWVSGKTCSTESEWVEDGANRKMQVHARLSRGRFSEQTDDDVIIDDLTGDYIDPTTNEFTDTNVLRIACVQEGPSGTTPSIDSMQNGLYLSNIWDCGLYYSPSDTEAKAKAEAAGYKTNYSTDESSEASGYNYMNNVRQSDVPHP